MKSYKNSHGLIFTDNHEKHYLVLITNPVFQ